MKNKEVISINKMVKYIDKALKYTDNIDFEQFQNNEEKQDATIFAISQIGELVKNKNIKSPLVIIYLIGLFFALRDNFFSVF